MSIGNPPPAPFQNATIVWDYKKCKVESDKSSPVVDVVKLFGGNLDFRKIKELNKIGSKI